MDIHCTYKNISRIKVVQEDRPQHLPKFHEKQILSSEQTPFQKGLGVQECKQEVPCKNGRTCIHLKHEMKIIQ